MDEITRVLTTNGIDRNVLALILMLPLVATLVTVARHIIGLKSFGMYTPILATFTFATIGIKFGLLLLAVTLIVGLVTRNFLDKIRIHYLSRLSIVITTSTIALLVILPIALKLNLSEGLSSNLTVLPIVIVMAINETFISTQLQKGTRTAIYLLVETLVISIFSFLLIRWSVFNNFVSSYPIIIIATLLLNFLIGRWQGLRLTEMQRFKSVFKKLADDKR